jgi:hypothetical protein
LPSPNRFPSSGSWEEDLIFEIGVWSTKGDLTEVVARAGVLSVAHSAFLGAVLARPGRWVILRQKAAVIRQVNEPPRQDLQPAAPPNLTPSPLNRMPGYNFADS